MTLDARVHVDPAETITVRTGKVELGQGLRSALARIAAEELDVALERIRVETADTATSPDDGMTVGSMSMPDAGPAMRRAAAQARAHSAGAAPLGRQRKARTQARTCRWATSGALRRAPPRERA